MVKVSDGGKLGGMNVVENEIFHVELGYGFVERDVVEKGNA